MRWTWIALAGVVACRTPEAGEATLEARTVALEASQAALLETLNEGQAQDEGLVADFLWTCGMSEPEFALPPAIDGAVLSIEHHAWLDLVRIDRGSTHGVMRGYIFDLYRGNQYKGRVRVETVQEDRCTAVVLRVFEGRTIEPGDSASTRI